MLKKAEASLQEQPLHQSNSESGSHGIPQMMMKSPTDVQVEPCRRFTRKEILSMTNSFKVVLGKGRNCTVYEGFLPGLEPPQKAAVKILNGDKPLDALGMNKDSFWNEVRRVSGLHHCNIVALLGYCIKGDQLVLVYEFMENGSLQQHLHGTKSETWTESSRHFLNWRERMQVAIDVAQGLEYLHNHAKPTLVHLDINPSSILLGAGMHAKITNFGISQPLTLDDPDISCFSRSLGYMDPAFYTCQTVNVKNDVYSYGVVLLELVTGKEAIAIDTMPRMTLVTWCREILCSDLDLPKVVDAKINPRSELMQHQLLAVVQLAMQCVDDNPDRRPSMREVLNRLYIEDHEEHLSFQVCNEVSCFVNLPVNTV
jgi:serine/threonine protein kinase